MAKSDNGSAGDVPVQPVDRPIICNPYEEPRAHWVYDLRTGEARRAGFRRAAGYWYKTERTGSRQQELFVEEERDDLPLVNRLRDDVRRWREADYRGASNVTKALLRHWARPDLPRRLFFCQREAAETIIYLAELRLPGKSSRTGFRNFEVSDEQLAGLLRGDYVDLGQRPGGFSPSLVDAPADPSLSPLIRLACKMATGSGKTVVMAMLISWAFCNRGQNPNSREFPRAALVCCPNLTVKERLQVLRPDAPGNYYDEFDLTPAKYRPFLQSGRVLVVNWHCFLPESEHKEGDNTYAVVNKGPETPETLARRVLGELYDDMPIMVLNDEGHHCWRSAPLSEEATRGLSAEEKKALQNEQEEATVWISGLDMINNANPREGERGIAFCVDLSATPFRIQGSGYAEGEPFPWIVSDFGLVDAIESGIVKIPRLPVLDTTGRPDPKYFRLWETIRAELQPKEFLPGGKPKPEAVYREAEGALLQIAGQWRERWEQIQQAAPGQDRTPPVLIIVCDNTDIAEVFYRHISGEEEVETTTEEDVNEALEEANGTASKGKSKRGKKRTKINYTGGAQGLEFLANTEKEKRTIRIDTKLLAEAESEDPSKTKQAAAEALRKIVATVGKPGEPGEHVRCVVSVAMLTEGWDANNVTNILGIRAFGSQLLCEQVVGRGLRRMDYTPDPETGLLTEEYVDVYGVPFSVIPFKGRTTTALAALGEDKPKNHVCALPERAEMEMRFPVVEGYVFALKRNLIRCDVDSMDPLELEPDREPVATFVCPTMGYREGPASLHAGASEFLEQNREDYYRRTHLQAIEFLIAKRIVDYYASGDGEKSDAARRVSRLQSRHLLFPQVFRFVEQYVERKVNFRGCHPCELGLKKYVNLIVSRLRDAIVQDEEEGEPPLLPVLNRFKPVGSTAEVNFKTARPCVATRRSHINQVVADTKSWEEAAVFWLEQCQAVRFYARNDHLGLLIPYEYQGLEHGYEPDFLVRLANDVTLVLEIKGYEDNQTRAKHDAARRWVKAVSNWGQLGRWAFHVCRDPQLLHRELASLAREGDKAVVG